MKQFFINGIEVSKATYERYLSKEFKRVKANCMRQCGCFDEQHYKPHNKIIMNDIKFEIVETENLEDTEA